MDVGVYSYPHGDPLLIDKIVNEFLSQGKFDKLRKECMSDADTKPAYQNLQQRVENTVTQFLRKQVWRPDLNKNQLRDSLRKHILESKFFDAGINRIVDQVVNPNVLATVFLPEVEEVVYNYLSIPRPFDKNQKRGPSDEKVRPSGREYEYSTSQESQRYEKYGRDRPEGEAHKRENHMADEDYKVKDAVERKIPKDCENPNDSVKMEPPDDQRKTEEKVKSEPEEETCQQHVSVPGVKAEIPSDESQESLNRMAVEGLRINEPEKPSAPDSDDSIPLEINEKSMSESRDSEDSIMNQMSPISQGRLTPDLEEETPAQKPEEKPEGKEEEKKPLTFIGRIPKIKREDSDSSKSSKTKEDTPKKEKLDVKNVYSSDESDSSKSYGKSDSDERRRKSEKSSGKEEKKREDSEKKHKEKKRESSKDRKGQSSKERHKDHRRERSRERHKKSSCSSSSSQRERSSSHRKSSHRHKDSKSKRKEEEKKKSKSTDDHGKERNKKEDRRSTDRDSNDRERGRSTGGRSEGESRKRDKEQHKMEEVRGESINQTEEAEVEKESGAPSESEKIQAEESPADDIILVETETAQLTPNDDSDNSVLDFSELFQAGALSRLEFPKLTDDFYVKFNSTGFRYFEEWEKTKLDCEEEFKEFVDEAENNLSLLSDDESDFELEKSFAEENQKTIKNLLRGLSNFRRSLMFDPRTSEFYKWTNNKFYQKFRKKGEKRERSNEKNESDESIKENIDRGEKKRALHLKLINKYRRKAMRMGKPRRRHRKPDSGGIKEKNENRSASEFFAGLTDSEAFLATRVMKLPDCNLVDSENPAVPNSVNSISHLYGSETVTLPESPEENEEWSKVSEPGKRANPEARLSESLPLNLPPSPDSDDINTNSGITTKTNVAVPRKRINRESDESVTPKKQTRRNYSQKYESQDLYKPRPILHGSRTRGRERGLERDIVGSGEHKRSGGAQAT